MSYTKHTWTNGDVITATKLNEMENGIDEASSGESPGGILIINETEVDDSHGNGLILDKTWQEIFDAIYEDKKACYIYYDETTTNDHNTVISVVTRVDSFIHTGEYPNTQYSVETTDNQWSTHSTDDYPFQPYD